MMMIRPVVLIKIKSFQMDKHVNIYEYYVLSGYNATISCNILPTFRDNISVPSSGVKNQAYRCTNTSIIIALLCFGRNIKTRIQVL
jgi:hypothetical protein